MIIKNYLHILRSMFVLAIAAGAANSQTITGHMTVCLGASRTTLSISTTGGAWSSGDVTKATIDATTGVVTGVAAGTATISYTIAPSTVYTAVVTVNGYPMSAIGFSSGSAMRCTGGVPATCTISPMSGNNWTSSDPSIATINTGGSVLPNATTAGTTTISYKHLAGNCYVSTVVTVSATPTLSVTTPVCNLTTQTVTATPSGGTWTSSNTSVGTVGITSGVFSAFASGGTTLMNTSPDGCRRGISVLVTPTPTPIAGSLSTCEGNISTLSSFPTGGTWSSSALSTATVGSSTGLLTGIAAGTANVTYALSTGCQRSATVTVNSALPASTGPDNVCVGQTISLSNAVSGGTWSSSAPTKATVTTATGIITGIAAGTANISYRTPTGCYTVTTITVNAALAAISGPAAVCVGNNITLTHAMAGGTWSTSSALAIVGSSSGIVTGITPGAAIITYTLGTGCFKTFTVQVRANPTPITGVTALCAGGHVTLVTSPVGGTWVSGTTGVGTIGASSGIFTGISAGTTSITYTATTGCKVTTDVTVNSGPGSISGTPIVCAGSSTTLTPPSAGGIWSTSSAAVAGITTLGSLNGINAGTATISYTIPGSCISTIVATVLPLPASIVGAPVVCAGMSTTMTNTTSGGTWASSNTSVATINASTGFVNAIAPGNAIITYTGSNGCFVVRPVSVSVASGTLSGGTSYCVGSTGSLSSSVSGGTWMSGALTVAGIDTFSGALTALGAGTAIITYIAPGGCPSTLTVTVISNPSAITGAAAICPGGTTTLSSGPAGGTWTSSNTSVATIGTDGVVTGAASGTSDITYTLPGGCFASRQVTVNTTAGTLGGTLTVCEGYTTTLGSTLSGGVWTSSNSSIASVGSSTGVVSGVSTGSATMTYTISGGCSSTIDVTVVATPAAIAGASSVCVGTSTTLTNSVSGGVWSSANSSIASVGSSSGDVTGIANGVTTISYTMAAGCYAVKTVSVTAAPGAITGSVYLCGGSTLTLSVSGAGGTWTTGDAAVAVVGSTGVVTGVSGGTAVISYGSGPGCTSTTVVTVLTTPSGITGTTAFCVGGTSTLTGTSGSYWSSSNSGIASVGSSTGVVTGVTSGTARITLTNSSTGCFAIQVVTVNPTPSTITGGLSICASATSTLTSAPGGGTWVSSNTSIADIGSSSGVLTGVASGTATITYTSGAGCVRTGTATVNGAPAAGSIGGPSTVIIGHTIALGGTVSGGTWSSSNTSVATVGSSSAVVLGVSAGTVDITHTLTNSCGSSFATYAVTVNAATPITGVLSICPGGTTTLANATSGGTWSSGSTAIATVNSSGLVAGLAPGTAVISYTVGAGSVTAIVTVNAAPTISGLTASTTNLCAGTSTPVTLTAGSTSGAGTLVAYTWSGPGMTTTTNTTGTITVTPSVTGTYSVSVSYSGSGCTSSAATSSITVHPVPAIFAVTGGGSFCSGGAGIGLGISGSVPGVTYVLYLGTTTVTTVSGTGSPISFGSFTTVGTYSVIATNAAACYSIMTGTATITSISSVAPISGSSVICPGSTTALSSTTTGGTWSSSDPSIATVGSTGVATGIALGVATISYSVPGCFAIKSVTVSPAPASIAGSLSICAGATTTLFSATTGGTWTSSSPFIANVGYYTGVASATTVGTTTITYALGSGCITTAVMTVNTLPSSITGATSVCAGSSVTLSSATSGGVWTSSDAAIATAATGGVVSGVSGGVATISYTLSSTGCATTRAISVDAAPAAGTISGPTTITVGGSTTLTSSLAGGTWSSSTPSVANIVYVTGYLTGSSAGTSVISYTRTNSCGTAIATHTVSVTAPRPAIESATEIDLTMTVYPNPSSGAFTINVGSAGVMSIYSFDGRMILQQPISAGDNHVELPAGLAAGSYQLRFETGANTMYSTKLIYKP
ncbi:MAG: Ig-like domain-containing protein [Taibaiella sp.]|nr:Ig-like domain-containing protein [Taibaiella sp.]